MHATRQTPIRHIDRWLTCARLTVWVRTDSRDVITDAAPIVRKFIGQELWQLIAWTRGKGWNPQTEVLSIGR